MKFVQMIIYIIVVSVSFFHASEHSINCTI